MDRRQYLTGVGVGVGTLLIAGANTSTALQSDHSLSIDEVNDPVEGGSLLDVTATIESSAATQTDPEIEVFVGDDHVQTIEYTLDPGDTATIDFQHQTYPVQQNVEFPVTFATEGDSVEQYVEVLGIDELDEDEARPDRDLTVQPDTTVLFEVDDIFGDDGDGIFWFVDGESMGPAFGPWQAEYQTKEGANYWIRTFESEEDYEMAVAVVNDEDPNRTARWDVTVDPDGIAPPSIDAARPETDELPLDEATNLSLDLSASDAALDRVVWWIHQVDRLFDVSWISGSSTTARTRVEEGCPSCDIYAWALTESNAMVEVNPWRFEDYDPSDGPRGPAEQHTVSIIETADPVEGGEFLAVRAAVENTGRETTTVDVSLVVGGETVDTTTVTVDPGERESVSLGYETYPVAQDVEFPVIVETGDSADTQAVAVSGTES